MLAVLSVIDLNLVYITGNPFAKEITKRKETTHEPRQNDFLSNFGFSIQTQIPSMR